MVCPLSLQALLLIFPLRLLAFLLRRLAVSSHHLESSSTHLLPCPHPSTTSPPRNKTEKKSRTKRNIIHLKSLTKKTTKETWKQKTSKQDERIGSDISIIAVNYWDKNDIIKDLNFQIAFYLFIYFFRLPFKTFCQSQLNSGCRKYI